MKYFVLLIMLLFTTSIYPLKDAIGRYILNDVNTTVQLKSRTQYGENEALHWNQYSSILTSIEFPKINTYLNFRPHIEFGHFSNHANTSAESVTRLNQMYVDLLFNIGTISVGEKRLSMENGRFLSDSSFNLLPRTFNQIGFSSQDNQLQLIYITSMTLPDTTEKQYFNEGSYIIGLTNAQISPSSRFNFHAYLFENIANTYSFNFLQNVAGNHEFSSTIAIQTNPSITDQPIKEYKRLFYDAIYTHQAKSQVLRLGTRFFEGEHNGISGFRAPYSSGHSWDGFLNVFQSNIQQGFLEDYRSIFGSFSTQINQTQYVKVDGYLFRNSALSKNLGSEVNVSIQDELIKDTIYWMYKVGQFIPGTHYQQPSELKMWLDFSVNLGESL